MNYSKNSKSAKVDAPNNYGIPIGAIVHFKHETVNKRMLDEFREKMNINKGPFDETPIEIIDSISHNGSHIMPELSGELFWYGWCEIVY